MRRVYHEFYDDFFWGISGHLLGICWGFSGRFLGIVWGVDLMVIVVCVACLPCGIQCWWCYLGFGRVYFGVWCDNVVCKARLTE